MLNNFLRKFILFSNKYNYFSSVDKYFVSREYNDNFLTASADKSKTKPESEKIETNQGEIIIPGGELYFNIKKFFRNYLENIAAVKLDFFVYN